MNSITLSYAVEKNFLYVPNSDRGIARKVRYNAYLKTLPYIGQQDELVFISIMLGYTNADMIEDATGMLLTSIRRSLTNLKKNEFIAETQKVRGKRGVDISAYRISDLYKNEEVKTDELTTALVEYKQFLESQKTKYFTVEQIQEAMQLNEIDTNKIITVINQLRTIE